MALKLRKSVVERVHKEESKLKIHTILLVDDETSNLSSLTRILSPLYIILTAKNGQEALELIENDKNPQRIHLIISDQRMPQMTGVEFLKLTIPILPKTIRMLLTGFTDIDAIISSINDGQIYKFLTKPIEPQDLLLTVKRSLETYDLEEQNSLLINELKVFNASLEQKIVKRTKELVLKNETIEEQNNQKKMLLHVLCHDLVNPIGAAQGSIEIITEDYDLNEEISELITLSLNGINQSLEIIQLIRELLALDEKKLKLDIKENNLRALFDKSLMVMNYRLKAKKIDLVIDIPEEIIVKVDSVSFVNSVLNNLLTNALKFSNIGTKIIVKAELIDKFVLLTIQDFGIGIPEELLEQIFVLSAKTSRVGTQGEMGTGFGMPLIKRFVDTYGGKIEIISSEKNENNHRSGTTITLHLPSKE